MQLNYTQCYDNSSYTCTDGSGNTDFGDFNRITWVNSTGGIGVRHTEFGHKSDGSHTTAGAWNIPTSGGQLSLNSNDYAGTWRIDVSIHYTNLLTGGADRITPFIILQKNGFNERHCLSQPTYIRHQQAKVGGANLSCIINPSTTTDVYTICTRLNKGSTTDFSSTATNSEYTGSSLKIRCTYLGNLDLYTF